MRRKCFESAWLDLRRSHRININLQQINDSEKPLLLLISFSRQLEWVLFLYWVSQASCLLDGLQCIQWLLCAMSIVYLALVLFKGNFSKVLRWCAGVSKPCSYSFPQTFLSQLKAARLHGFWLYVSESHCLEFGGICAKCSRNN